MGANVSCPQDFELGSGIDCHMKCPANFKYVQEGGGSEPLVHKCVFVTNNTYSVTLTPLEAPRPGVPEPEEYASERTRVSQELKILNERIQRQAPVQDKIISLREQRMNDINEYNRIQSEYASYSSAGATAYAIKEVKDSLPSFKPPVAGSVEIERRNMLESSKPSMLVIQVALVVVALCLLVYVLVPAQYAHIIAFLLLSVGIAVGIFLRK